MKETNIMKNYLGTKEIKATPMKRGEYNDYRGWTIPADENPNDDGYLVEYLDSPSHQLHPAHEHYISWSPKDVFERAYREVNGLTFGQAIEALKMGKRVAREGWNGKGMFLFLLPADDGIPTKVINDPALRTVIETETGKDTFDAYGSIRMWTADKKVLTGWLASQTDMLAEDWVLVG
jgi:hypothetical protein